MGLMIYRLLIQRLLKSGIQLKMENCLQLWLVVAALERFGGNAPRDMSGRQQLGVVRGVLAAHIVQATK